MRHCVLDLGLALEQEAALQKLIEKNPIEAWCAGKGTGNTPYFVWDGNHFRSVVSVTPELRNDFQHLVRELVDWRLAAYLDRRHRPHAGRFICQVLHAQGHPMLQLPSRTSTPGIPTGWVNILANDTPHVANFAEKFVEVVQQESRSDHNVLADIMYGWFGADVGQPGTRCHVAFETVGDALRMQPVGQAIAPSAAEKLEDDASRFQLNQGMVGVAAFLRHIHEQSGGGCSSLSRASMSCRS